MKSYQAVTATGQIVATVLANSEHEAKVMVAYKLCKPSRKSALKKWEADGSQVQEK